MRARKASAHKRARGDGRGIWLLAPYQPPKPHRRAASGQAGFSAVHGLARIAPRQNVACESSKPIPRLVRLNEARRAGDAIRFHQSVQQRR